MHTTPLEIFSFITGCLFYALKGYLGKVMVQGIVAALKWLLHITESETKLYKQKRAAVIRSKRLASYRGR